MSQFFLGGDFRFFWPENVKDFASFPSAWDSSLNTGLGQSQLSSLWITSYFNFTTFFSKLGLNWSLIQIIFWVLPALFLSFFSSFLLFKFLFKDNRYSILSGIIYSLNTYFLMILTGGQLGVSLSYSLVPLIILSFIKLLRNPSVRNLIFTGLFLSLQILFDPRIVYVTLVVVLLYFIFNLPELKSLKNKIFLLTPFTIAVLLNSFWILPLVLTKSAVLPTGFDSASGFKFFSFADFSHSLSLLHPNWPENIFGKIYFLDPKFLVLPILAFSSLLFKKNRNVVFFSSVALLGIFLAKGANPPFEQVNQFLFGHFPGMSMFRDPTKWYILIALGYSILIPYSLKEISKYFKLAPILFILYFLFLIAPIFAQIKVHQVSQDYIQLKNFLNNQSSFSRTLWIPKWQRFGYFSNSHPAIGREELLKGSSKKQISQLNENLLKNLSIRYIIVPYDSQSEIFLKDRKYDPKQYRDTVQKLRKIKWLKEIQGFDKLNVFEFSDSRDHFWSFSKDLKINYALVSTTEYKVQVRNAKKGDLLVFSEGFDRNWIAENSKLKVQSLKFDNILNSFNLPENGDYEFKVHYVPQEYVEAGLWLSSITLLSLVAYLLFGKNLKKW